jgi:predicted O-linked N-acetylglucosamine transferase (SPINDLY family)
MATIPEALAIAIQHHRAGRLQTAEQIYRQVLAVESNHAGAHHLLGVIAAQTGKLDEAVVCWRRSIDLNPDFADVHNNLGNALRDRGKRDEAVACYRRALELEPGFAEAHNNLGVAFKEQGKLEEAVTCYRRALELKPNFAGAHSNLLLALQYFAGVTPAALAEAHAEYDRRHAAPLRGAVAQHENVRGCPGRLRLGFVFRDLRRHPVGYFLVRVLENLDKQQVETVCYSDRIGKDDLRRRLHAAAGQWRDVIGMSDQRLAEQIRADRIDILFDMAGHTARNRLLVFARRPAPVQITWAGYVGTTGLKAMDYLLADRYEVPPGAERHYQERVLRMPEGYVCYDPPGYAPPVGPLPARECGQVTFGCFNNPAKVTPHVIEVWARILRRVPGARLVLKSHGWNEGSVGRRFTEMFVARWHPGPNW